MLFNQHFGGAGGAVGVEGAADVDAGGGIGHAHALDVVVLSGDDFCGFFADDVVDAAVGGGVAGHFC